MDMESAYRDVGSFRAAADICGTTPKTVKRAVLAAAEDSSPELVVAHNYDVVRDVVAERVAKTQGRITAKRLLPVAAAAGYSGSTATSGGWSPRRKLRGVSIIIGVAVRACGRRATCSSLIGVRSARCSCSARCWHGRGSGSCTSPTISAQRRHSPRFE